MKIIDRQIKEIKKSLEKILKEYKQNKAHKFSLRKCSLCKSFALPKENIEKCLDCPLYFTNTYGGMFPGCIDLLRKVSSTDHQDIAGFLQSLLISLELEKE